MNPDTITQSSTPYRIPDPVKSFWALLALAGLSFSIACLFLGMRGVMRLGGMVASGGPYAIAHPAPQWVWIMPVSIWIGLFFAFFHAVMARRASIPSLVGYAWPALFLSLGWNFFEFGFRPPGGNGLAWGWLVCGVVFALMGGVPLYFLMHHAFQVGFWRRKILAPDGTHPQEQTNTTWFFLVLEIAVVLAGIFGALRFFRAVE